MSQQTNKDLKLGELLRALGAVEPADLTETVKLAVQVGLPLGRALVLSGHLNEDELDAALEVQALLKSGNLTLTVAQKAFGQVRAGAQLQDALEAAGWDRPAGVRAYPSRLGSLLFDAKIISKQQLEEAQRASYETGMPLGRMLNLMGLLSQRMLATALDLQRAVRDERISHNQAVLELHTVHQAEADAPRPEREMAVGRKPIRLGEILMLSGVLTESDIMNALEHGLTSSKPLGDVLLDMGLVTRPILNLALELQASVCDGSINIHAATDTLGYVASTGESPAAAVEELSKNVVEGESVKLGELLKLSGFIEEDDIKQAIDLSSKYPSLIGKMLVVSGAIDEATLLAALRCQFLLRSGHVSRDDAVEALKFAKDRHLSLDDALDEMGLGIPVRKKEH